MNKFGLGFQEYGTIPRGHVLNPGRNIKSDDPRCFARRFRGRHSFEIVDHASVAMQ